jgi:hypothetical protein
MPSWLLLQRRQTNAAIRQAYSHPPGYVCDKGTEIWHVSDDHDPPAFAPYFVARCECMWVGTAFSATEPDAEAKARDEAHKHGSHVVADTIEMP